MQVNLNEEISHLSLGDQRRNKRFLKIVGRKVSDPLSSIPQSGDDWADIKMTYSFYNNEKVKISSISSCIEQATTDRCNKAGGTVLNILDTTSFNFSSSAEGLGYLDHGRGEGLMVHNCLAIDEQGCPLGIIDQKIWARDWSQMGKSRRGGRDITSKESYRWIAGMSKADELLKNVGLRIHIGDRESDFYELLSARRPVGSELLIRATHERKTLLGNNMWEEIERQDPIAYFELPVCKVTTEGERLITMKVQCAPILLSPPQDKPKLPAILVYGIMITETKPTENKLQWRLITSLPVLDAHQALRCVRWYSYRWRVERFHYILKSGCRLEDLQLRNVNALKKAIIVYSLCAFKIMELLYLARKIPNAPCTPYIAAKEWQVLNHMITKSPIKDHRAPTLSRCIFMIAKLGGYIGRKNDGPPGIKNLWRGLQQLNTILKAFDNYN